MCPRIEIGTISSGLTGQLKNIFLELGIRATCYCWNRNNYENWKNAYKISVRGIEMFDKFMNIIKPASPKQ